MEVIAGFSLPKDEIGLSETASRGKEIDMNVNVMAWHKQWKLVIHNRQLTLGEEGRYWGPKLEETAEEWDGKKWNRQ